MSNSASLAAAKNRRSRPSSVQIQQPPTQQEQLNTRPRTQLEVIQHINSRISVLENNNLQLNNNESGNFVTKRELELLKLEGSVTSTLDNKITNNVDSNSKEITLLKNANTQLSKSLNEMNSMIMMIKANLLTHTNELNELKIDFNKFIEENFEEQPGEQKVEQLDEPLEKQPNETKDSVNDELIQLNINEKK